MDKLSAMAILLRVVETGSLSAAAKRLNVPLATVSRRIAELEAHLTTRMLNRSSRRLSLTEAGRLYVDACKRILDDVEEAERAVMGVHKTPRGRLTVTAPVVFGRTLMMPIIADFLAEYPEVDLKLVLADRLLNLLESDVDVALRIGELGDSSLVASRLGTVRRVTCGSPSYLATHGRPQAPEDMANHICVTFDNLASPEAWRFARPDGEVLVPVRSRLIVTTAEAAIDGAEAGLGLTRLLSYQVADARRAGRLEVVLDDHELPAWPVSLVHAGQKFLPRKVRAFLDFATPRLRERLRDDSRSVPQARYADGSQGWTA